ncbi:MAG: tetratricopeptide repeat protein [Desulfobacterales bacterium]|nr:tetratricopeptide repeat protein [Desulfobacterales bacterium]
MKPISYLLVDDNSIALRELTDILKYYGYTTVYQARSGNDGWTLLKKRKPNCIISAWELADMSGLTLLKMVKNDDRFYNTNFFLTHSAFTKVKVLQAGKSGVTGLIVVPYNLINLKQKFESISASPAEETFFPETENNLQEGLKLLEGKNFDKALEVFNNLIKHGETAELYYNIGYIKTAQGKYEEGIKAFRKAVQLDRLFAKAYKAMGEAYKKMGKVDEAQKFMQKAADIFLSKEKDQDAEEVLNEILKMNPDTINVYNSMGVLYRRKGNYSVALKQYEKALIIHPNEPNIYYNIGRLYIDLNDPAKAKASFAAALKVKPDFKEAREVFDAIELGTL